jgi:glycosyltransferase involved in cell wall biosynthesis
MKPKVSIIIPTYNSSPRLSITLESILKQVDIDFEIIAVDAGSTDHTLEIFSSYQKVVKITSVSDFNIYKMINHGIGFATGQYINFLFPGDFYIHDHVLLDVMDKVEEGDAPHLIYGATLIRNLNSEIKFLYRHLNMALLRKGQQPTSLQACWFMRTVFDELGGFSIKYGLRGGLEFLCRFCLAHKFKILSLQKALTEYDLRLTTSKNVREHFKETFKIILYYFGWVAALQWLIKQKDVKRLFVFWLKRVKFSFLGER